MGSLANIRKTAGVFEPAVLDDDAFLVVLDEAMKALDEHAVEYVFIGGVASSALGRSRWTHDVDIFVSSEHARGALDALRSAGFRTEETDPHWLYKGIKDGALIDVIFRSKGHVYLDEEMVQRAQMTEYKGRRLRIMAPEDLVVLKAIVHDENVAHHWHDALAVLSAAEIDWDYLVRRATEHGARRVLSLLIYAQSEDVVVSSDAIRQLFDAVFQS
ncbi:MAG: nucleotidyltransferase [Actinomycetota bacterium]|nr:nucleotidyltransferase family protein [Actinomycetota bacterium]